MTEVATSSVAALKSTAPLLLIHPVGVGLSSCFWDRFKHEWQCGSDARQLLAPDLLGCGDAPMPRRPLSPEDWATALIEGLRDQTSEPVVLVSQGASLPIALALLEQAPEMVSGLVAISPPGWRGLHDAFPQQRARNLWRLLFSGPAGGLFYRYARRRSFLKSFSIKNLFARSEDVDHEWLETLEEGSRTMDSRWAVFSFLAGFWRRDWEPQLTGLRLPLLIVFGRSATGIGRSLNWDDAGERLHTYRSKMPNADFSTIEGRNVLPYESTQACVDCVRGWLHAAST